MKDAKSMYRGGDIISASDCDYQSAKTLGLVCPFCSEAVFVKAGSIRETTLRNGKKAIQLVNPHFGHYKTGSPDFDCELRSQSKEGLQQIENQRIEAKNQRLKLYNSYLWEMVREDRNIHWSKLSTIFKTFPRAEIDSYSVLIRREFVQSLDIVYDSIEIACKSMAQSDPRDSIASMQVVLGLSQESATEEMATQSNYINSVDVKLHNAIACEVADFLATNSAGYVFKNIVIVAIYQHKFIFGDSKIESLRLIEGIGYFLGSCHWIKQIEKRLS
jgi:hypothetical protein